MSLGERIHELRIQQNISQGQLADLLEVSRQAVSKWENGLSSPDTVNLIRLAELLETDIEYLATGRRTYSRRPPVVLTETVEKIVEVPVYIKKTVEIPVEKPIIQYVEKPVVQYVEKPVLKKIQRTKYVRNPFELAVIGLLCFVCGLILGSFL